MLARLDFQLIGPGQAPPLRINEGEALQFTLRALDSTLAVVTPTTVRYRLEDLDRGSTITDWTTVTPATSMTVTISGSTNSIRNGCSVERRQVIAEATDIDGTIRRVLSYEISDLQGIT
jgi:hypothetical protein